MNRFQIFRLVHHQTKLNFKRSPALEQSQIAKVMMYLGAGLMAIYLIFIGMGMSMAANDSGEPAFLLLALPVFLIIDFFFRFVVQHTPAMLLKPYMLLPLPRRSIIDTFLYSSVLSGYNAVWLFMFVPYAYIIFFGDATLSQALAILCGGMLLVMANSQWYLLVRTLTARSIFWWALPAVVYGIMLLPLILDGIASLDAIADVVLAFGTTWLFPLLALLLLALFLMINRRMQYTFAYEEIARQEKKPSAMKHVTKFTFLERFGQVGEYLKLELKSNLRNKAIRSRMIMSLTLIIVFSLLITYTNIYDTTIMLNFWCYYCFAIYGMTTLIKIMGPEGNYIDLLMVHHENILKLLKAKYFFHMSILVVPFIIMLPAVIEGKFSLLMMLAYMLLSSGPLYCTLFQLAVYNKQTLPLEQKITGKNNMENGLQLIIELLAMFIPMAMAGVLLFFLDEDVAYTIMALFGLTVTLAYPLWLRNIYRRMMVRKYRNLEGFHASR